MAKGKKTKSRSTFSGQMPAMKIQVKTHYYRGRCTANAHAPGSGCQASWGPEQCKIVFRTPNGNQYSQCTHVKFGV